MVKIPQVNASKCIQENTKEARFIEIQFNLVPELNLAQAKSENMP